MMADYVSVCTATRGFGQQQFFIWDHGASTDMCGVCVCGRNMKLFAKVILTFGHQSMRNQVDTFLLGGY